MCKMRKLRVYYGLLFLTYETCLPVVVTSWYVGHHAVMGHLTEEHSPRFAVIGTQNTEIGGPAKILNKMTTVQLLKYRLKTGKE
jgi:hypothetical protein